MRSQSQKKTKTATCYLTASGLQILPVAAPAVRNDKIVFNNDVNSFVDIHERVDHVCFYPYPAPVRDSPVWSPLRGCWPAVRVELAFERVQGRGHDDGARSRSGGRVRLFGTPGNDGQTFLASRRVPHR